MQVQVHTNDKIQGGESLAQWVQQEVSTKLARFKESVTRVEVFFSDSDGASKSGAQDKRCVIEARPAGRQPIAANAESAKVADALTAALEKLQRGLEADQGRVRDNFFFQERRRFEDGRAHNIALARGKGARIERRNIGILGRNRAHPSVRNA